MQKNSKTIIAKFFIFVLAVIFLLIVQKGFGLFFSYNGEQKQTNQVKLRLEMLRELQEIWQKGSLDRLSKTQIGECKDLVNMKQFVGEDFYHCNPLYLNCVLHHLWHDDIEVIAVKKNRFYTYDNLGHVLIHFKQKEEHFSVKLKNTCRDVFLPQRKYSAGERQENIFLWDNFNQKVYIDKYYVSNLEVLEWKKRTNRKFNEQDLIAQKFLYKPSTHLNHEDRALYCASLGGKILESRYFDAATYFPNQELNPPVVTKYPYAWTKKRKRWEDENHQLTASDCFDIYSKECESLRPYKFYESLSTSWIGLHFALGNYAEYLPNKFDETKNLKLSSFNFDKNSPWHEVGKRGDWSHEENKQLEVAFRCMAIR